MYIDPAKQFFRSKAFEENLSKLLLDNNDVMVKSNFNARLLKKIILSKLIDKPDTLILGSSRVMLLNHHYFKDKKFYNAWVPDGAAIQDDLAMYYLFQKRGWHPKTVLICLDTWLLCRNNGREAWKALPPEFLSAKKIFSRTKNSSYFWDKWYASYQKYIQLLSSEYFLTSLKKITATASHLSTEDIIILPTSKTCLTCNIEHPDGSVTQPLSKELTPTLEADMISKKSFPHVPFSNYYTELDPEYKTLFENFVAYLAAKNINVIFYLPPYEPVAYEAIESDPNYKMILVSESYFKSIASKYHFKIIGSYNPKKLGLTSSDFIDHIHLKTQGINKIFTSEI